MARAIQLARVGLYNTSPNPSVGCVLVKDGRIIGEGWHQKAGEAHAEINALAAADAFVQGATAYVTLEPCSHQGKTPPCSHALVEAGISRVVYAIQDPNPEVAGQGIEYLKSAGVEVIGPLLESEAAELNCGFIKRMKTGLPRVIAKSASSLDGRTAMQSGESKWITGEDARLDVQKLRARSCAIITGVGTVAHDNPALNVRDRSLAVDKMPLRQPLRVVVDSNLQVPLASKVFDPPGSRLLVYANVEGEEGEAKIAGLQKRGVECLQLANTSGKVDLAAVLKELAARNCNEVMVEAGAGLMGALLKEQLIDELYLYMAATIMGSNARPLAELPFDSMDQQLKLDVKDLRKVGNDYRWHIAPLYA